MTGLRRRVTPLPTPTKVSAGHKFTPTEGPSGHPLRSSDPSVVTDSRARLENYRQVSANTPRQQARGRRLPAGCAQKAKDGPRGTRVVGPLHVPSLQCGIGVRHQIGRRPTPCSSIDGRSPGELERPRRRPSRAQLRPNDRFAAGRAISSIAPRPRHSNRQRDDGFSA